MLVTEKQSNPTSRVEYENSTVVIDRVEPICVWLLALSEDLEFFGDGGSRHFIAVQTEEGWMEGGNILTKNVRRIAFGVERDEKYLKPFSVFAQSVLGRRQLCHRRRTYIWAVQISKEDSYGLSTEIRQRPKLTVVISQPKVIAPSRACDVHGVKSGLRDVLASTSRKQNCDSDHKDCCQSNRASACFMMPIVQILLLNAFFSYVRVAADIRGYFE